MLVSSLLGKKGSTVVTIAPTDTVAALIADLARHRVGALVVSVDDHHVDGIVSERDIIRQMSELHTDVWSEPVSSIMSSDVQTCRPTDEVSSLMSVMTDHRIRHVPVTEDGLLCGIVSIGDVVKSRIDELEKDRSELMEYISAR